MARRTKEELRLARQDKAIDELISSNKYLRSPRFYKGNYWSWAAWDSWAAQGKAGGCGCCSTNYYNGSLRNKRAKTKRGGRNENYTVDVSRNLCYDCVSKIETKIEYNFPKH
jgi:hypothetical protein